MFKTLSGLALLAICFALPSARGQDYAVEVIEEGPDAEAISPEIAALMADNGYRVKRGSRTAAEIWLCKEWKVDDSFVGSAERLYPFTPGQLIGVLHFSRRGSEFRNQTVSSGWYTWRFGLQPVDGNHEGTSPTRDFLLMVEASSDAANKEWSEDDLNQTSGQVAGTGHPAMLCLQPAAETSKEPGVRYDDFFDWWILQVQGKGVGAKNQTKDLAMDVVVAGHASE